MGFNLCANKKRDEGKKEKRREYNKQYIHYSKNKNGNSDPYDPSMIVKTFSHRYLKFRMAEPGIHFL